MVNVDELETQQKALKTGGSKDYWTKRSEDGDTYIASTTEINAGTGDSVRVTLENPNNSGVNLHIYQIITYIESGPLFPHVYVNPDTGIPSTQRNISPTLIGSSNSSATLSADAGSTSLSGGQDTGIEFGLDQGRNIHNLNFIVPPGTTVGLNIALGGLSSGSASFTAYYVEEPV